MATGKTLHLKWIELVEKSLEIVEPVGGGLVSGHPCAVAEIRVRFVKHNGTRWHPTLQCPHVFHIRQVIF